MFGAGRRRTRVQTLYPRTPISEASRKYKERLETTPDAELQTGMKLLSLTEENEKLKQQLISYEGGQNSNRDQNSLRSSTQ